MTARTPREVVDRALQDYRGDNLERATMAFSSCTPAQMQEQYGQSGSTRQQILDGYREHVESVERAQAWVKALAAAEAA